MLYKRGKVNRSFVIANYEVRRILISSRTRTQHTCLWFDAPSIIKNGCYNSLRYDTDTYKLPFKSCTIMKKTLEPFFFYSRSKRTINATLFLIMLMLYQTKIWYKALYSNCWTFRRIKAWPSGQTDKVITLFNYFEKLKKR